MNSSCNALRIMSNFPKMHAKLYIIDEKVNFLFLRVYYFFDSVFLILYSKFKNKQQEVFNGGKMEKENTSC